MCGGYTSNKDGAADGGCLRCGVGGNAPSMMVTRAKADGELPPTPLEIAKRLRALADEMDGISVAMDYYGGFSEWAQHGREIAGAGAIARQWADEIEAANAEVTGDEYAHRE